VDTEDAHWGWVAEWFPWEKDPEVGFTVCTFIGKDEMHPSLWLRLHSEELS
jgi:hypothetical protein